ncbi:hypothetical protein FJT64_015105 [Amphibalanus amphitrite]|uniref:Uncharacterized protein n=1 Tax=Amphibalanus amphitrite TaxID=1232801 RepID=A0A6A4XHC7_AMPAM|nr:hypothetical protein FJT64_015105 [Amphibalanus amphitrite]
MLQSFTEKSRRAKQQATAELRRSATTPELVFSAASAVHQEGRRRAARLLEEAGSPGRGGLLKALYTREIGDDMGLGLLVSRAAETPEPHHSLTTEEALAVTVDLDLTKAQYSNMRLTAEEHGCKLYPAYKRVAKAEAECLPPASAFTVLPDQAQLATETKAVSQEELQQVGAEISALQPLSTPTAVVRYELVMTMVGGKMVNVATGTASSQRCCMCGLTLRKFNDLTAVAAQPVTNQQYGLSTLHCWLRSFDYLLRLSYRLPLQEDSKERRQQRKAEVQEAFRTRMGLRVDELRAGGSGNSNDGNTARFAFRSPAGFAACTGVDQELIDRVGTVLQAVSCLHRLDIDALSAYCRRTAELYVERYSHHPMSTTLHKLLSHSAAVVESCHLPIGMMSEEAAEATHKRVRQYRLRHTRKDSRIHTMSDLLGYLLVASDPLLSSLG